MHRSTDKSSSDLPQTSHQPSTTEPAGQPIVQKPTTSALEPTSKDSFAFDWAPVDLYVEEGELSDNQEVTITDTYQYTSQRNRYIGKQ